MYLRDFAVYADEAIAEKYKNGFAAKFHRDSCCIVELFLHFLKRSVVTRSTAKVLLILKNASVISEYQVKGEGDIEGGEGGTLTCMCPFSFAEYECADSAAKSQMLCAVIHNALLFLSQSYNWGLAPFDSANEAVVASGFTFRGMFPESWLSPDRKYRIRLWFEWDLEWVRLYGVLFRNRSSLELTRQFMGRIVPENGILRNVIRKGKWVSTKKFRLESNLFFGNAWTVDFSDSHPE